MILVLDDIHWADAQSLELLEVLLTDQGNQQGNSVIIGCYRSNGSQTGDGDNHNPLFVKTLQALKGRSYREGHGGNDSTNNFGITELSTGNLGLETTHEIVMKLLGEDSQARTW